MIAYEIPINVSKGEIWHEEPTLSSTNLFITAYKILYQTIEAVFFLRMHSPYMMHLSPCDLGEKVFCKPVVEPCSDVVVPS